MDERGPAAPRRLPILLIHGWPGGPLEFLDVGRAEKADGAALLS